jgi:outer membrane protein assembly factor BamB
MCEENGVLPPVEENIHIRAEKDSKEVGVYSGRVTVNPGELNFIRHRLELNLEEPPEWSHSLPAGCRLPNPYWDDHLDSEEWMVGGSGGIYVRIDCGDSGYEKRPILFRVSNDGTESNLATLNGSPYFLSGAEGQHHLGPDGRVYVGGYALVVFSPDLQVIGTYSTPEIDRIGQPLVIAMADGTIQIIATAKKRFGGDGAPWMESWQLMNLEFNPDTGVFKQLWAEPLATLPYVSGDLPDPLPVAGSGNSVAYVLHGNVLDAVSLAPGAMPRVRFSRTLDSVSPDHTHWRDRLAVWTSASGDQIRVVHQEQGISSFTATGEPLGWPASNVHPNSSSFISIASDGTTYLIGSDGALHCLSPEGELRWRHGAGYMGRVLIEDSGLVHASSWRDVFAMSDTPTGPTVLSTYYGIGKKRLASVVTPSRVVMLMEGGELRAFPR